MSNLFGLRVKCVSSYFSGANVAPWVRAHSAQASCARLNVSPTENILHTLHVAYIGHDPYAGFPKVRGFTPKSLLATRFTVQGRQTPRCPDSGSLLLKHGSQAFRQRYACISQSIPSLTTPARATVLSGYTDGVFG